MKHLKQEFDKLSFKDTLMYAIAIVSLIAGFVIIFCGMLLPPKGETHDSVLTAFGLVLIFVGTLLGLDMKYANMTASFKQTIIEMISSLKESRETEKKDSVINLEK
ncbi:MAG: hypothetical protein K2L11_01375 [Muribaculaceae bacterium]|nr:hypothetical protein [Muribaculaceae bacterium]